MMCKGIASAKGSPEQDETDALREMIQKFWVELAGDGPEAGDRVLSSVADVRRLLDCGRQCFDRYKSMIAQSPAGDWSEFPFDEAFWPLVAPLSGSGFVIGYVDEIGGPCGKVTTVVVTRAEVEVLVRHYLNEVRSIDFEFEVLGSTGSASSRQRVYAEKRLMDFIHAGAISADRVAVMSERLGDQTDKVDDCCSDDWQHTDNPS